MYCWMRPCSFSCLLAGVEVLDQGREGVEFVTCRIPADENFPRIGAEMESQHSLLIVHVYFNLFCGFRMWDGVAIADLDFASIFASCSQEGADDAFLIRISAERVIED